jgi:hypothetical protein
VRATLRVVLVVAGAVGFCFALSSLASADVVNPKWADKLASNALLEKDQATAPSAMPKPAPSAAPKDQVSAALGTESGEVAATPAPEQQVRQAPPQIAHEPTSVGGDAKSPLDVALRPLRLGMHQVGSYLGRVVSACQVGVGSGTGGPVLILAVLGLVAALERHRAFGARPTTDEDKPEFLYAGEISPPG